MKLLLLKRMAPQLAAELLRVTDLVLVLAVVLALLL
jgi:hypothetical protein